ncbi:glycoside hydrolase family 113 [Pontibacter actiniarum]|uniref:GTA TIM-barrel-like domain-containing protein n=1 Tax=Pontibacter actiniarum TaxID=323450 RepID=A0A1X9YPD6_9BACT|nr:hypothetical protein [Pontibacter actiniarum]ARS34743.1 hypothetical protein CA264_04410 [Pontibacter actiniarum]
MKQLIFILAALSILAVLAVSTGTRSWKPPVATEAPERFRGVNWVAGDTVTQEQLRALQLHHVSWIAQTPFGWQHSYNSPEVRLTKGNRAYWGERDSGLIHTTRLAKQLGLKTLLKPHIWLTDRSEGKWVGAIQMQTEAEWQQWFSSYSKFILHYAMLAEKEQIEALCIGTELYLPAVEREQDWRQLIREVRSVYHGQLTYAANWYKEYEEVKFWDALDFIGIQAYFPLTQQPNPSVAQLRQGWQPHMAAIEEVQQKYKKPVVFTEVGYKNTPDAAIEPWQWPDRHATALELSEETQANAYEALYQQFWQQPWFGGTFIWKWYPRLRTHHHDHLDFTPQGKPAGKVMARWYDR